MAIRVIGRRVNDKVRFQVFRDLDCQLSTFFPIVDSHGPKTHRLRKLYCEVTNASNPYNRDCLTGFYIRSQFL